MRAPLSRPAPRTPGLAPRTLDPTELALAGGGWLVPYWFYPPPPSTGGVSSPRDVASGL